MVLTPQMAISHLVMTIGVGISQKKNIKKFDLVTILWFDPYINVKYLSCRKEQTSEYLADVRVEMPIPSPRKNMIFFAGVVLCLGYDVNVFFNLF